MTFIDKLIEQIIDSLYMIDFYKSSQYPVDTIFSTCFYDVSFIKKMAKLIHLAYYLNNQEQLLNQKINELEKKYFKKHESHYYQYIVSFINELKKLEYLNASTLTMNNTQTLKLYYNDLCNKNDLIFIHLKKIISLYNKSKNKHIKNEHKLAHNIFLFFKLLRKDIQRKTNFLTKKELSY